jgi:hypothetical protein
MCLDPLVWQMIMRISLRETQRIYGKQKIVILMRITMTNDSPMIKYAYFRAFWCMCTEKTIRLQETSLKEVDKTFPVVFLWVNRWNRNLQTSCTWYTWHRIYFSGTLHRRSYSYPATAKILQTCSIQVKNMQSWATIPVMAISQATIEWQKIYRKYSSSLMK